MRQLQDARRYRRHRRQARAGPRGPERADGGRRGHRRHAAARRRADHRRTGRQGRDRARPRPFRSAQGQRDPEMSLALIARPLQAGARPRGAVHRRLPGRRRRRSRRSQPGDIALLENTRFHRAARRRTIPRWSSAMAALGDLYVNDAFSAAHRAHASTEGLAHRAAGLCRPLDAGRARGAREGAGQSRASGRGGGRRRQGLDQARRAQASGRARSIT